MKQLDAYSIKDLQHFSHLITMFEGLGADIPTIRQRINDKLYGMLERKKEGGYKRSPKNLRKIVKKFSNNDEALKEEPCTQKDCNGKMEKYMRDDENDGLLVIEKCKKCQFSRIIK